MSFGQKIRELRVKKGLTQSDLADGIVTPSMISLIESNRAKPSDKVLQALAERLGVDLEEIQQGESSVWEESSTMLLVEALLLEHKVEFAKEILSACNPELEAFKRQHKLLLAECHVQEKDYSQALQHLEELEEMSPGEAVSLFHIWLKMGRLYVETGKLELGTHYYKKAYHLSMNDSAINLIDKWKCVSEICLFYLEENRQEDLDSILQEIDGKSKFPCTLQGLAETFLDRALEAWRGKRFQYSANLAHSSNTLLSSLELVKRLNSLQFYKNNVQSDGDGSPVPWQVAIPPRTMSVLHLHAGNYEAASSLAKNVLEQAKTPREKTVALQTIAMTQEAQGQFLQAIETIRSIIAIWEAETNSPEQVTKYSSQLTQLMLRAASHLHDSPE